jgi:hypothetical protein
MTIALLGMLAIASVLAWVLAARRPEHRPAAIVLTVGMAVDVIGHLYDGVVLAPIRAELGMQAPWTGWARAAGALAHAIALLWPATLVGCALVAFPGKRPWPAFAGWAAFVVVLAMTHPMASDGSLQRFLTAAQSVGALTAAVIVARWFFRATRAANSAQLILACVTLAEVVSLLGTWRYGPFERWMVSRAAYLMMLTSVVIAQGRYLWSPRSQLSA